MTADDIFEAVENGTAPPELVEAVTGKRPSLPEEPCSLERLTEPVTPSNGSTEKKTESVAGGIDLSAEVAALSALDPLEYDRRRKVEAQRLGVRVPALDKAVMQERNQEKDASGNGLNFTEQEPWADPVDGAALLLEIRDTVRRFIICEEETASAAALWCAFTWFVDVVQVAPLAIITAPEKRCGKSQMLDLVGRLSRRPLPASNITVSALFRVIEQCNPTLLIDEADSFVDRSEDLRGIINSGHTRQSAFVIRTVGEDFNPQTFSTWGAKALCGIGKLAGTIMDRGIILELRRKLPTESVQRLRHAPQGLFPHLASMLARWSADESEAIGAARPALTEALNDREQDSWEPLLAIADHAGGDWPEIARQAAVRLSERNAENTVSTGVELLADIKEVFEAKRKDKISTKDLLAALNDDDSKSWSTYNRGQPMKPPQLAKRLRGYGIAPGTIRTFDGTPKGYRLEQFSDVFNRYLENAATPTQPR